MKKPELLSGASFAEADIRPLRVGRRFWIGPAGEPAPAEGNVLPIWLAPGPAFGTGAHPTTQLCLHALERHLQPGARVLDLGTGTGILAIAAARLGAQSVFGLDIDPGAVDVARANVRQNDVEDQVRLEQATLSDLLEDEAVRTGFGWVMANILAHVIADLFDQRLPELVAPYGWLVLSGFLRSQTPLIRAGLASARLELVAQESQEEWVCIIARRRPAL